MSDEIRENTKALYSLKESIAVQTVVMKHQTKAITELKEELTDNGIVGAIVDKVTKNFYKCTSIFGFIATIIGVILYFVLKT